MRTEEKVKMFLFARWISTCYADEHLDDKMRYTDNPEFDSSTAMSVLNREDGKWWKGQLEYFEMEIYPNLIHTSIFQITWKFFRG